MKTLRLIAFGILIFAAPAGATNWNWTLSGSTAVNGTGTFTACESTTKTKLTGTYVNPATGFVHMTESTCTACTTANCSDSCIGLGTTCSGIGDIYAVQAPGAHLIVQPVFSTPIAETQPIYNVISESGCPTATEKQMNFMFSQWNAVNDPSQSWQIVAGDFRWNRLGTAGYATIENAFNASNYTAIPVTFPLVLPNTGCTSGTITMAGQSNTDRAGTVYITSQNEFFFQTQANHAIFGVPRQTIPDATTLTDNYAGFAFSANGSNTVQPLVNMVINGAQTQISGNGMNTDGTVNSSITRTLILDSLNAPLNGMIEGRVYDGTNYGKVLCVTEFNIGDRNSIFCSGSTPGAPSTPYTLLLTSAASWTWMAGSNTFGQAGSYGTKGTASPNNLPGGRSIPKIAVDSANNVWLFGGNAYDSTGTLGQINDLWKFDGTNWTWVSGSSVLGQSGTYGTKGTAAATNMPGQRIASGMVIDGNNMLWLFAGQPGSYVNDLWKYDGANWTWVSGLSSVNVQGTYGTRGTASTTNSPGSRTYPGMVVDRVTTTKLWMFGGGTCYAGGSAGQCNDLWSFDTLQNMWTWVGGSSTYRMAGSYGTLGTASSTNLPGSRQAHAMWVDSNNIIWIFGGSGVDGFGTSGPLNDLWKYDGTNWTWMSGTNRASQSGSYGSLGVPLSTNLPGGHYGSAIWTDENNNFYLLGGQGCEETGCSVSDMGDFWKWDGTYWTWLSGPKTPNNMGTYGTKGIPSPANQPANGRYMSAWVDLNGALWVFGAANDGVTGTYGRTNTIWKASSW